MTRDWCLAVDFGTTNTVAVVTPHAATRGDALLQRLKFGNDWRLPSAVYLQDSGRLTVGVNAQHSARQDPSRFVRAPKREMGPHPLVLGGTRVPVVDVVAAVLRTVREEAEKQLDSPPRRVVLTRPVQWAVTRRTLFEEAARQAGFADAAFLEEPVAAGIRLGGLDRDLPSRTPFAVLDFGGGTLDVAVVQRSGEAFDVLASDGVDPLGGEDIDDVVFSYVIGRLSDQDMARQLADPPDHQWDYLRTLLRDGCRLAKEHLSELDQDRAGVGIPPSGEEVVLTRSTFDNLVTPILQRATGTLKEAVLQNGLNPSTVPVYLVGGSSRIPTLAEMIRTQLRCEVRALGDAQFVVSEGAALWAAQRGAQRGRVVPPRKDPEAMQRMASELLRVTGERAKKAGGRAREAAAERAREAGALAREVAERAQVEARARGEQVITEAKRVVDDARSSSAAVTMAVVAVVILLLVILVASLA